MKHKNPGIGVVLIAVVCSLAIAGTAQTPSDNARSTISTTTSRVPTVVNYSGEFIDLGGKPRVGINGVTFLLYRDSQGGAPLWMETLNVHPDRNGHYTVVLGSSTGRGLPAELFVSGEARWLAVQASGEAEQVRVLLVAVPYALKAGDAETIRGLPPSAFVLAAPNGTASGAANGLTASSAELSPASSSVTTTGGTVSTLPLFTTATNIQDSAVTQTGSGTTAKIGINNAAPTAVLDVKGSETVRGIFTLAAGGKATAAAGKNSQPLNFTASVFNSSTASAVNGNFRWQAEPAANNTSTPSGTLNLLYGLDTAAPAETGLKINSAGQITFAAGQTFPGGGGGTVTSVGLSAPSSDFTVSGSPVTGSGTLALNWSVPPTNAATANAIVRRDTNGSFLAKEVDLTSLNVTGTAYFGGNVGIGTTTPAAELNMNAQGGANQDTFLIGNKSTKGLQLRDTGTFVDLESIGVPLYINSVTQEPTYFGTTVGIGTAAPQALLNLNYANTASADTLLIGNNSKKGLQLRDTGTAVDLESIGVPLYVNSVTQEPTYFGTTVGIGTATPQALLNLNYANTATSDKLLIGNNTTKGLQMRDTGSAVDLESIGVPLWVNNLTQQDIYLNPSGGNVVIGSSSPESIFELTVSGTNHAGFAAVFFGKLLVEGDLQVTGSKDFRIDHPLDPTNKYLTHASIESSEVLNQYSGNVVLDEKGESRVEFPDWFSVINEDFRYQLTAIGAPGPNLYVAQEMKDNSFTIAGGKPGMRVSWQVTARRNDPYMKAHPMVVEQDKPAWERGYYSDPSLYGAPNEKGVQWAHQRSVNKP